jgi:hypothetical protein
VPHKVSSHILAENAFLALGIEKRNYYNKARKYFTKDIWRKYGTFE